MIKQQIQMLEGEIAYREDINEVNVYLYNMAKYWDSKESERTFYPSKEDYLVMCSEDWLRQLKAARTELEELNQIIK